MFQNIQGDTQHRVRERGSTEKSKIISNIFTKNNIIIYIITLMVSSIGIGQDMSIFSLSIIAAALANNIPAIGITICGLIGNLVGFGVNGVLAYIITLLLLMVSMFIFKPIYNEENRNEKIKIGKNLFIVTAVVTLLEALLNVVTVYDVLASISAGIIAFVFYKIFVNSLVVMQNIRENRAFSIEEVIGASLLVAIAVSGFGYLQIFGFSIKNILSILIVLVLGWKNGVLVGATGGVTIGTTLGVITSS